MRTQFDILKKDRKGTFQWLEAVNDIETAKGRLLQLSTESPEEFVAFRRIDLQVVATSKNSSVVDWTLTKIYRPPHSPASANQSAA